jgi:Tfp pilus assembly protein PilZ
MPEQTAASLNISTQGVYFVTDRTVSEGLLVQVSLRMSPEIAASEGKEWQFTGRVAHVESLGAANGQSGVGVQFLYYEVPRASL